MSCLLPLNQWPVFSPLLVRILGHILPMIKLPGCFPQHQEKALSVSQPTMQPHLWFKTPCVLYSSSMIKRHFLHWLDLGLGNVRDLTIRHSRYLGADTICIVIVKILYVLRFNSAILCSKRITHYMSASETRQYEKRSFAQSGK